LLIRGRVALYYEGDDEFGIYHHCFLNLCKSYPRWKKGGIPLEGKRYDWRRKGGIPL
jgi:hypothetical protein